MQFAKDSFYLALRDRLAALHPECVVVIDGIERPAVLVVENEPQNSAPPLPNAYYLSWSAPQIVSGSEGATRPLMKMECRIAYCEARTLAGGVDRGRALTALDLELLRLVAPPRTPKADATRTPAVPTGTYIFWGSVEFGEGANGFDRSATLPVFFFAEEQP